MDLGVPRVVGVFLHRGLTYLEHKSNCFCPVYLRGHCSCVSFPCKYYVYSVVPHDCTSRSLPRNRLVLRRRRTVTLLPGTRMVHRETPYRPPGPVPIVGTSLYVLRKTPATLGGPWKEFSTSPASLSVLGGVQFLVRLSSSVLPSAT